MSTQGHSLNRLRLTKTISLSKSKWWGTSTWPRTRESCHAGHLLDALVQENAARTEGLPPSQGGKYVGFGSGPAPAPRQPNDEVAAYLSKGLNQLSTAAGGLQGLVCWPVSVTTCKNGFPGTRAVMLSFCRHSKQHCQPASKRSACG